MSQPNPDRQSQEQDNLVQDTNVGGDLTFAPVQNIIETQIIQTSVTQVTQRSLIKTSPYLGLKRFNFKDRDCFFGRDKLIARLFEAVNRSSLSLVLGASGSGKSSVVRAGLIPELKKSLESQTFYDFIFTPNQDPFDSLYRCLLSEEKDYSFSKSEAEIALEAKADTLTKVISSLKKNEERWLIFVDQFEELFTIHDDPDKRKYFISGLIQVAQSGNSSIKIVLAMRSDFLEEFSSYPDLSVIANQNNIHLVTEMYPDELRQAIEQPAARHGVTFEEGLVEQIIKEVEGQKGYLPLLQYTLNLLWESECKTLGADGRPNIEDRTLNKKGYAALEGVRGALQKHIKEIYSNLNQDEQAATKEIFLKLVTIVDTDSGSRAVSRRAYRDEFVGESEENLLNKFIDEKLLVSSSESSISSELQVNDNKHLKKSATVEIAHEILLYSWDDLKRWLEQEKQAIILKNWLAGETRRWQIIRSQNEPKSHDELLKGSRLAQVVEFRNKDAFKNIGGLRLEESEFIDASVEWRDRQEKEKEVRRQREIRTAWRIAGGSLVALLVVSGLALMAFYQWTESQKSNILTLVNSAKMNLLANQQLEAMIDAVNAEQQSRHLWFGRNDVTDRTVGMLTQVLNEIQERNQWQTTSLRKVEFSPDGQRLAILESFGHVNLWDLTRKHITTFDTKQKKVYSSAFSPDSKRIATASKDGTIKLWDLTGTPITTISTHQGIVSSVVFSPDKHITRIATAGEDGTIKLWDLVGKSIKYLSSMPTQSTQINEVAFSPNGKFIATAGANGTTNLWDLNGKPITIYTNQKTIFDVKFTLDSKHIATAGRDGTIKLWDLKGNFVNKIDTQQGQVSSLAFSLDGQWLVTGGSDGTTKLWDLLDSKNYNYNLIRTITAQQGNINSVAFSPNSKWLAIGVNYGTTKLWNLSKPVASIDTNQGSVYSLVFSRNGQRLAFGGDDGSIYLWDSKLAHKFIFEQQGKGEGSVYSVVFSPNEQWLASGESDGFTRLWDLTDKSIPPSIFKKIKQEGSVYSLVFSPDSQSIATLVGENRRPIKQMDLKVMNLKGKLINTILNCLALDSNKQWLVTYESDGTTKVWDLTGKPIAIIPIQSKSIYKFVVSPDGQRIATAGDSTTKLWDLKGNLIKPIDTQQGKIVSLAFSSNRLATGGSNGTIKLWDLTGKLIATFSMQKENVYSVAFSPNGQRIAFSSGHGIKLWQIYNEEELLTKSCDWLWDYLHNPKANLIDKNKNLCDSVKSRESLRNDNLNS